jgi:hypothetical protein
MNQLVRSSRDFSHMSGYVVHHLDGLMKRPIPNVFAICISVMRAHATLVFHMHVPQDHSDFDDRLEPLIE